MLVWCLAALLTATPGDQWPAFRGDGTSISSATRLPLQWSETQNVAWTATLPGYGQSSPVVRNGHVFVSSTSGENKEKLVVSSFSVATGEQEWSKEFPATQTVKVSDYVSRGAPTPIVDESRVYVFFESGDLLALTQAGEVVWQRSLVKDYGEFQGNHGVGASIAATNDALIVAINHGGPSYILAASKADGTTTWKQEREANKVSWSSPVVIDHAGRPEVVISSNGTVDCYDARSGEKLWWVTGLDGNTVASATPTGEQVLIGSSKVKQNLAIALGGTGDVTESGIKWRSETATSSFGSPLVAEGVAYFVNRTGVLFAVDAVTGEALWNQRLPDACWASPVAADGRIYVFTKGGTTVVMKGGREKEQLAENALPVGEQDRLYGVAIVNGAIFVRMGSKLWKLSDSALTAQVD